MTVEAAASGFMDIQVSFAWIMDGVYPPAIVAENKIFKNFQGNRKIEFFVIYNYCLVSKVLDSGIVKSLECFVKIANSYLVPSRQLHYTWHNKVRTRL